MTEDTNRSRSIEIRIDQGTRPERTGRCNRRGFVRLVVSIELRAAAPNNDTFTELSGRARATAKQLRAWVRDAPVGAPQHCARQQGAAQGRDGGS